MCIVTLRKHNFEHECTCVFQLEQVYQRGGLFQTLPLQRSMFVCVGYKMEGSTEQSNASIRFHLYWSVRICVQVYMLVFVPLSNHNIWYQLSHWKWYDKLECFIVVSFFFFFERLIKFPSFILKALIILWIQNDKLTVSDRLNCPIWLQSVTENMADRHHIMYIW